MARAFVTLAVLLLASAPAHAAEPALEPLWPAGAPGALGKADRDVPAMTAFLPATDARKTGTGVVIFPGGGYWALASDHEGVQVARFLNSLGVAAFVVRYRHAPLYQHPSPLLDAQRAIRIVRSRAGKYGLSPDRIGVMGFSAGGHLAATASTRFDAGNLRATDPVERASCRPDFAILGYPVISFSAPYTHRGSAEALLGRDPDLRALEELSAEKRVGPHTPPTFLFHTSEDKAVPPENSVSYYLALRAHGIPAELHIYEKGKHGVGLAPEDPILATWSGRLTDWLKTRELLDPPPACKLATRAGSPVGDACASGGIPAAKALMRQMVAAAKLRGYGFECDGCHKKEGGLADGAGKRFEELVKAAAFVRPTPAR